MNENHRTAAYYNSNTAKFVSGGGGSARTGSLHRALLMPGAGTAVEQMNAIHALILGVLRRYRCIPGEPPDKRSPDSQGGNARPLIADLGCGVGASMQWMAGNSTAEMVGITISPVQAEMAFRSSPQAGPALKPKIVVGSYASSDDLKRMTGGRHVDASYMIESFVHAPDAAQTFGAISSVTRSGGLLIVCDDFPSESFLSDLERTGDLRRSGRRPSLSSRLVRDFREGWHIHSFTSAGRAADVASRSGWIFVQSIDLTRFVNTGRPRDVFARAFAPVLKSFDPVAKLLGVRPRFWENVIGGAALQRLIRRRLVRYQVLVLQKTP